MDKVVEQLLKMSVDGVSKIIFAIILLIVGFKLIKLLQKLYKKTKGFNKLEKSVQTFIDSAVSIGMKIILFMSAASIIGIPMTSMITILGSFGLALGLALQGGLSNIAGGLMIMIFKPFKVGDYINTSENEGTVLEISLFHTSLCTLDNKKVILPNGNLSNSVVINYTAMKNRRVDLDFSVSYNSNIDKVRKVLYDVANENKLVLKEPKISVILKEHADSALVFTLRTWIVPIDYLEVKYSLIENVKKSFDKNNIEIPYPQMDIHMKK